MEIIANIMMLLLVGLMIYCALDAGRDKNKRSTASPVKFFAGIMIMLFAVALIIYIALAQVPNDIEPQVRQLIAGIAAFLMIMVLVYIGLDAARDKDR